MRSRVLVGVPGVLAGLYGLFLLLDLGLSNLWAAVEWLAGGVILHDGVLAPAVLLLAAIGLRVLPKALRTPAVVGFVVLGTVTVVAIPVLGRFGARADNATLLDRPYVAGWLGLAALVLVGVGVGVGVSTVLGRRGRGPDPRR